jgi:ATP-binding cassette subfamily C protein CydD/ATP-binding cassette subfamily C protein CydCD
LLAKVAAHGPGRTDPGELVTLATRGLDALDAYFARYLPQLVLAAVVPVIVLLRITPADLTAAVTIMLTMPLIPVFMALVGLHTVAANRRQFRLLSRLSHHFLDVVAGLPTLKAFGRASVQAETVGRISDGQRRVTMRTLRIAFLSALVLELLATLSVALVAVGIGLRLVSGHLDLATGLLVLILAPEAYLPLRQVGANYHASAEGLAAAEQVFAVLDAPEPVRGECRVPVLGNLSFDNVTVAYDDRRALGPFTATIRPGEIIALTGPSGAGKSTVLSTILGFVPPSAGRVTVAGAELSDVDLEEWRRMIAWVPQRPFLFAGTVADNIRLGDPQAGDDAVRTAARRAGVTEFLDSRAAGFDTVLGDDGAGLSAGQRQRIALARAFLRDAPLILLDEPTANLDGDTEAGILVAIRNLTRGRTVIMAAHRPSLIAIADREIRLTPAGVFS